MGLALATSALILASTPALAGGGTWSAASGIDECVDAGAEFFTADLQRGQSTTFCFTMAPGARAANSTYFMSFPDTRPASARVMAANGCYLGVAIPQWEAKRQLVVRAAEGKRRVNDYGLPERYDGEFRTARARVDCARAASAPPSIPATLPGSAAAADEAPLDLLSQLETEEVEPGVLRILSDGHRDLFGAAADPPETYAEASRGRVPRERIRRFAFRAPEPVRGRHLTPWRCRRGTRLAQAQGDADTHATTDRDGRSRHDADGHDRRCLDGSIRRGRPEGTLLLRCAPGQGGCAESPP